MRHSDYSGSGTCACLRGEGSTRGGRQRSLVAALPALREFARNRWRAGQVAGGCEAVDQQGQDPAAQLGGALVIGNVAVYWLTGTAGSSIRFYYEDARAEQPQGPTTTPTALAMFKGDFQSIRRFAERDHENIVSWHAYEANSTRSTSPNDAAGHYAAHEATEVLLADIREFFDQLR